MYLYDQNYELKTQFKIERQLSFKSIKTNNSSESSDSTFLLNGNIENNIEKKNQYFLGNTFQKMKIDIKLNTMKIPDKEEIFESKDFNDTKNSFNTSSSNISQIPNNIRTSYLLEKYEFSK